MATSIAIAKREFRTFFNSPIAYIVLGAFLVVAGFFFFSTLFLAGQASLRPFFGLTTGLFVFLIPAITMRLLAEEKKSGTMELLLTMPLNDWEVVWGKFLAALGMVAVGLLCTLPYAFTVAGLTAKGAGFDWGPVFAGYVGELLLAGSFLSVGLWASALSPNQIVGFIIAFLLCGAFWVIDKVAIVFPESLGEVFQFLSADYHFTNIARGVFDQRDVVFYLSVTAVGLLLTSLRLTAARK
jgi:ABC-2 type transport system permease protein